MKITRAPRFSLLSRPLLVCAFTLASGFMIYAAHAVALQERRAAPAAQPRSAKDAGHTRQQRLAPPAVVTCDRDRLTVYSGRVTSYRRTRTRTLLRIETDWDTVETVTVRHARRDAVVSNFLIENRKFTSADWRQIESRPGVLREGVRANVWVCSDGRNPIIDWFGAAEPPAPDVP